MEELTHNGWEAFLAKEKRKIKRTFSKEGLNFLTIHYLYLIGMSFLGSIICVASGNLQYIDALFFSVGAATQSGLNTVDVNQLNYAQQITLYLSGCLTNPIIINTFVVFVRLYWFEKRFQHVVKDALHLRRTRSRLFTHDRDNVDADREKGLQGVNGRRITVVGNSGRVIRGENSPKTDPESSGSSEQDAFPRLSEEQHATLHRNITFAQDLVSPTGRKIAEDGFPSHRTTEQHLAVLERQRNQTNDNSEVLRIPGPRESDRGKNPEAVSDASPVSPDGGNHVTLDATNNNNNMARFRPRTGSHGPQIKPAATQHSLVSASGIDRSGLGRDRAQTNVSNISNLKRIFTRHNTMASQTTAAPYLSWQPTIGRNSAFVNLTEEQREELGGIEYRSLKLLRTILICYYLGWHIFGVVTFLPWILNTEPWGSVVDAAGESRVWWAFFSSATLFNDLGFTLTPDSFISFQSAVYILLIGGFLIVIGNTGFPCLLRYIIWLAHLVVPNDSAVWEELRFLLDHPRRCFTLLFPARATWVLFGILIVLNGLDLIFFFILDLNDDYVTAIPPGLRFVDGLFQAISTRTAGTQVINLSLLHPGIQVSYMIMMYISVFPIAISVRRTNVYEQKSLGIYSTAEEREADEQDPSYIGTHLRKQLSFDLWFIFLALFIIAIAEGNSIRNDPGYSLFSILFEIVSAYGTVGLSLGYPNVNASLSSQFSVVSKLVIVACMLRGRHRGLPYQLDRAILLPSESLHEKEDRDAQARARRGSLFSETNARPNLHRRMSDSVMEALREESPNRQSHSAHGTPHRPNFRPRPKTGDVSSDLRKTSSRQTQ